VNVDRRGLGTSVVRVRVLAAGLVLLAAGGMILGWGSRSRQSGANVVASVPMLQTASNGLASSLSPSAQTQALAARSQMMSVFGGLPLMFEPNQGQANLDPADPQAKFMARGAGYSLLLGPEGAILNLSSRSNPKTRRVESLEMKLAGANPAASLTGADMLPGKSNYFIGNDSAKWRQSIPQFAKVRYENIYPGINLVFYGNQGHLEYDFQVAPGSDPNQAELAFDGSKSLELKDGALVVKGEAGSVRLEAPRVYQQIAGREEPVEGSFVLRGANRAGFAIGSYDHSRELVIDPVLTFSTYFGGTLDEHDTSVAVDGSGNIYLAGSTDSVGISHTSTGIAVFQPALAGARNVYIAKIQPPQGSIPPSLVYVTYLGGDGTDIPVGISVDGANDPVLAGTTSSTNFPTTVTAYQQTPYTGSTGTTHAFATSLRSDFATLLYSSYLSGNGTDTASGMTIDAIGHIFVTGTTTSNNVGDGSAGIQFPASTLPQGQPFQAISVAGIQFFVTEVDTNATGRSSITYSTYFGGENSETTDPIAVGGGIAADTNGNVYFTGTTNFTYTGCAGCSSSDFPIKNAYQPCLDEPPPTVIVNPAACTPSSADANPDAFVAKLNPTLTQGQQLSWSTYLGGSEIDSGTGIAIDSGAANVYITGTTNSSNITNVVNLTVTSASYQLCLDTPVNPIAGVTTCPVITQPAPNDAFVARLSNPVTTAIPTNTALTYFSYLGGTGNEAGLALAVDTAGGALVTGWTQSVDFPVSPTPNNIQGVLNGPQDAFTARLNTAAVVGQTTTGSWANYFGGSAIDEGTSVAVDNNQNAYFAGDTNSTNLQVNKPLSTNTNNSGGYDAFVTQLSSAATLAVTGQLTLASGQSYVSAGNQATFVYTITNNGPDLANNINVTIDLRPEITKVPLTLQSIAATSGTCTGASTSTTAGCVISSLQSGSTATVTEAVIPTSTGGAAQFNGGTVLVTSQNNITAAPVSVSANVSDFTLSPSPSSATILQAGDTAVYQVTLTPHPVYSSSVSLTCTGAPIGAGCVFSPTSVTMPDVSPAGATLSITTTARPIPVPTASLGAGRHVYAIWLFVPGLALLGLGAGSSRRRRRIFGIMMLCFVFSLLLVLPSCSHSTTPPVAAGTPPGTYAIVVVATSGSDSHSTTVQLTVP
jgi:hypothetical protein